MNDLFDLESDRIHHLKRNRPFAAGDLPLQLGLIVAPLLLLIGILLGTFLSFKFGLALLAYLILTFGYSVHFKRLVLVDILCLASLYTLRILAGGYAASVPVSQWLLLFSMFFFLSLACVKRYSELYGIRQRSGAEAKGRGYVASDLESIAQFGSASGYLSVLVFALYLSSTDVVALYAEPKILWLICPLLLYWISRVWLLAQRGEVHEDPIVFALDDRASYLVGLGTVLLLWLAI